MPKDCPYLISSVIYLWACIWSQIKSLNYFYILQNKYFIFLLFYKSLTTHISWLRISIVFSLFEIVYTTHLYMDHTSWNWLIFSFFNNKLWNHSIGSPHHPMLRQQFFGQIIHLFGNGYSDLTPQMNDRYIFYFPSVCRVEFDCS